LLVLNHGYDNSLIGIGAVILKGEKCLKRGAHVGGNHGDEYMPQFINFFKKNLL
jgi:hypothetical protein